MDALLIDDLDDADLRDLNERVALIDGEDAEIRADLIGDIFRQYGLVAG